MQSKASPGVVSPVRRRRRRRSPTNDPLRKLTLQLSKSVVEAIKAAVNTGEAPSANVFVEDAVRHKLRERRRAKVYAAYEEASRDPGYMPDLDGDMSAFDVTLSDGFTR
jgi:Arc/MetJ-type ribon-helix-helix transcriptional regulator